MKQSTSFPVISFGTAAVTLYTSKQHIAARQPDRRQYSLKFFLPQRPLAFTQRRRWRCPSKAPRAG